MIAFSWYFLHDFAEKKIYKHPSIRRDYIGATSIPKEDDARMTENLLDENGGKPLIGKGAEELLRTVMVRFVDREIIPVAKEIDEREEFPFELFRKLADVGAFGIRYPAEAGGGGGNTTLYNIMCEEIARGSMSMATITAMQALMGTNFIYEYGTPEHHEKYLKPALKGEKVAAFALTEPDAGTDLTSIRTTAVRDGDGYVINGTKTWITNAPVADMFTVLCQTDRTKGIRGVNFFLIDRRSDGLSVSPKFDKIGTRAAVISEVAFDDVHIPLENRLGDEGRGIGNLMRILARIRIMTASLSLGLARAAYDDSFRYASERVQFGKPIGKFQAIRMKIASMATEIEASRHLIDHVTRMIDRGDNALIEASMAKYFVSEVACRAADQATRIYGSYSFSNEYAVSRYYRDTRFLLFGGGTSEILQDIIARQLGL